VFFLIVPPKHGSCQSYVSADTGVLCDKAKVFGETIRDLQNKEHFFALAPVRNPT